MEDQQHAIPNDKIEQGSNDQTTIEDLRRLTQAPSTQPLVTEAEFSVEDARSARPRWTQPLPKFALVGAILFPVFGLVCWFVLGGGSHYQQAETLTQDGGVGGTQAQPTEEMAKLQAENAKLKTGMALNDQVAIEEQMRRARAQEKTPKVTTQEKPSTKSRPAPAQVSSVAPSRSVATYSAPQLPRRQTESLPRPTAISRPASAPSRPVNPMQQWQQLAQLGSYGSMRPERMAPEFSSSNQKTATSAATSIASSIPTARIAPTSAIQPFSAEKTSSHPSQEAVPSEINDLVSQSSLDSAFLNSLGQSDSSPDRSSETQRELPFQSNLPILQDAETTILEGNATPPSLIAGTSTAGVLVTPIVISRSGNSDQFAVILSEPLTDSRGRVAFPAGAQILFQVSRLSETGQVHLAATTAIWEINGHQQELVLPQDAIQVRGEAGEPLIAEHYQDRGDEIAGMDAGQFLLGAIGRAAGLYTRSDTRVQTRGSSTVITEDNPEPNIIAGLLEGGTDAILETIQERNQRAVERLEELPNARFIEAGTAVEIFVNQSMFMPM